MNKTYPLLFSGISINGLHLENRVLMAPIATNMAAPDGGVTDRLMAYYAERARGEVGLVIVENANIDYPLGVNGAVQLRIDKDSYIPGLGLLREAMYDANHRCKVALQLNHPGAQTRALRTENRQVVGPSHIPSSPTGEMPLPLSVEEIDHLVRQFALGAARAQKAGFDAVEIHGGFCYLLAQFLSPRCNVRTDEYGGSVAARARFAERIVRAVREKVGPRYPVLFRLNADEFVEGGTTLAQSTETAKILEAASVDLIHVTAGSGFSVGKHIEPMSAVQGWKSSLAAAIKQVVNIPVAAVGSIREAHVAEGILARKEADCIALGRALLADPHWVRKVRTNRVPSRCISCNVCAGRRLAYDLPIRCTVNPALGCEEQERKRSTALHKKKLLVVGGGPAGMKAAIEAARDGHDVILAEKSSCLGGRGRIAIVPPGKDKVRWLVEDLIRQAQESGAQILLNTEVDMDFIHATRPDHVLLGIGSDSLNPMPAQASVRLAEEVLHAGTALAGKSVAVVGGGSVGCECAEFLADKGQHVVIYEMREGLALDTDPITRTDLLERLVHKGIGIRLHCRMLAYSGSLLTFLEHGKEDTASADTLVFAGGVRQRPALMDALAASEFSHSIIGDCRTPGRFVDATRQAYMAVARLRTAQGA